MKSLYIATLKIEATKPRNGCCGIILPNYPIILLDENYEVVEKDKLIRKHLKINPSEWIVKFEVSNVKFSSKIKQND